MQHSSTLSHAHTMPQSAGRAQREVAGSKSLASMLPTILTTGMVTLVITAVMRLVWVGFSNDFFAAWMEAWLTTWPIAFPLAYLSKPLVNRLTSSIAKPVASESLIATPGLQLADVRSAAQRATEKNHLAVNRKLSSHRYY